MKNKKSNIHGIISIIMYLLTFGIGVYSVVLYSLLLGLLYFLFIVYAFIAVAVVYCSKCQCREHCNHIIIGKISVLASKKNNSPYTLFDIVIGLAPMLLAIIFPQYWLIHNPALITGFWLLLLTGGLEAYLFVCNKCMNYKCKMCRNKTIIVNNTI